jgi:hypothetical protein
VASILADDDREALPMTAIALDIFGWQSVILWLTVWIIFVVLVCAFLHVATKDDEDDWTAPKPPTQA